MFRAANGCFYCHSQQVRADYAASDIGIANGLSVAAHRAITFCATTGAASARPRMGPDLSNIGKRAPAEEENDPPAGRKFGGASASRR